MRGVVVLATAASLSLGACEQHFAIAVVGKDMPGGGVMRGSGVASLSGTGSFNVSGGGLSCGGTYNSLDMSRTITIPVLCNDGRKGLVTATRDNSGLAGGGRFTLNDGTTGDFIFGPGAERL